MNNGIIKAIRYSRKYFVNYVLFKGLPNNNLEAVIIDDKVLPRTLLLKYNNYGQAQSA